MTEHGTNLVDWVGRLGRDAARRVAAHPDAGHLSVVTARDLAPQALRGAIETRWMPSGELHGRRTDSISNTWFVVSTADGEPNVELLTRWARERALIDEDTPMSDEDWNVLARAVVDLVRREREQAERIRATATGMPEALAARFLIGWACRLEGDRLVGHRRPDNEPHRWSDGSQAASQSPVNALFARRSRGPVDTEITADVVAAYVRERGLIQSHERAPEWADVVTALLAEVERAERVARRRAADLPAFGQPRRRRRS